MAYVDLDGNILRRVRRCMVCNKILEIQKYES
jgi:hypothetical protein